MAKNLLLKRVMCADTKTKTRGSPKNIQKNDIQKNGIQRNKQKSQKPSYGNLNKQNRGLKKAIRNKCLECSDYQIKEIRNCPVTDCALHSVRPYQLTKETNEN